MILHSVGWDFTDSYQQVPPGNLSRVPDWWRGRDRLGQIPLGKEIERNPIFLSSPGGMRLSVSAGGEEGCIDFHGFH